MIVGVQCKFFFEGKRNEDADYANVLLHTVSAMPELALQTCSPSVMHCLCQQRDIELIEMLPVLGTGKRMWEGSGDGEKSEGCVWIRLAAV